MSERARALEQALRMLRNECHAIMAMSYDAIKDSAGYTNLKVWIARVEEADALLADPPPSGASPQAETSEDMGDGWYVTVGRWGESLVTIEQRCLSGKADLTDDDAALIRGAAQHLQAFIGQPAPVSPVEPTTCPKCRSNTRAYSLAVADVIDGRMAGMTSCRDEWHSRMPMVSPVEPEPPTLRRLVADLQAHAREHNWQDCDEPLAALLGATVEPEPCVWRMDRGNLYASCVSANGVVVPHMPIPMMSRWKVCPYCGAPLKVER